MIPDPEILQKWGKLLWKGYLLTKPARRWWLQRRAGLAQTAFRNQLLYDYLEWKYAPYRLFQQGPYKYPIVFFPIDDVNRDPNSVLCRPLVSESSHEIVTENAVVYDLLYDIYGLHERDDQLYMLKKFTPESRLLQCWVAPFSQSLKSSHSLEWEILETVARHPKLTPEKLDRRLKLRAALHSSVADPLISGDGRAAALATSVLILCSRGSDFVFWLKKRGPHSIPVNVSQLHVIPAGMFRAASGYLDAEYDVIHNFKREYLGELFSRPSPSGTEAVHDYFYSDPALLYLQQLFDRGDAHLELLGIAVDLLNLRPEVCMMLRITTPEWSKVHGRGATDEAMKFHINSEFLPTINENFARTFVFPIPEDRFAEFSPDKIAPPAAVCLWAAQERLLTRGDPTAAGFA